MNLHFSLTKFFNVNRECQRNRLFRTHIIITHTWTVCIVKYLTPKLIMLPSSAAHAATYTLSNVICVPATKPNYIELLSTKMCLAWNFFLDKNKITNQIFMCCILLVTGIQLLFAHPKNHVEICLLILFLSRQKCHAKQLLCA